MKCVAPVTGVSTQYRASGSESTRCQREGRRRLGGKLFCYQHARIWAEHYRVVERIRAFPDRTIYSSE